MSKTKKNDIYNIEATMKTVLFYIVLLFLLILNAYSGGEILINGIFRACPLFFEPGGHRGIQAKSEFNRTDSHPG